jgi:hypothetical protein
MQASILPSLVCVLSTLQASICTELIKRLLQYGPALTAASAAVAELDCLCSLAAAARELGYCRPQLVADSMIHIKGGVSSVLLAMSSDRDRIQCSYDEANIMCCTDSWFMSCLSAAAYVG